MSGYSQNDEERVIAEAVADIHEGVILDIGAYDGRTRSNSLALVEKGWSGVLVEPSPVPFAALLTLHGWNPRLALVNCLVGVAPGVVGFWPSADDGVSTTEAANYEKWKDAAEFGRHHYAAQLSVAYLAAAFPRLRDAAVVSIDTEGTSVDIFKSFFPPLLCRPRVFCVEYDDRLDELTEVADRQGYAPTYRSNENVVLVRR